MCPRTMLKQESDEDRAFEVPGTEELVEMPRSEALARYLALFRAPLDELSAGRIVGESTPSYLFYGEPVGRVYSFLNDHC